MLEWQKIVNLANRKSFVKYFILESVLTIATCSSVILSRGQERMIILIIAYNPVTHIHLACKYIYIYIYIYIYM